MIISVKPIVVKLESSIVKLSVIVLKMNYCWKLVLKNEKKIVLKKTLSGKFFLLEK